MNEVRKFKPSNILVHLLLIILVVINLFPLYWMLTFSLKSNDEILGYSYVDEATGERVRVEPNRIGLPQKWEWSKYSEAMNTGNMGQYFINSLVVAVLVILIVLIASFMATYSLTRLVWKGRKAMNKFFMLGLTIPIHAAIVPVYVILSRMKLLNTYSALIFPYAAFALSMGILISIGFMGDIPYDLDEAAFLDGCGVWGIFCRIIFPLMMPASASTHSCSAGTNCCSRRFSSAPANIGHCRSAYSNCSGSIRHAGARSVPR